MALSITLTASNGATKQLVLADPVIAAGTGAGLVTNFTMTPGHYLNVDGDKYGVETAGNGYSLTNPDPHTLRFEIHKGDNWAVADSGLNVDRAFVQNATKMVPTSWGAKIPPGTPVDVSYQMMVEPNANGAFASSSSWFLTNAMHNDDSSGVHTSPPFALQIAGNRLQVIARYVQPGGDPSNSSSALKVLTLWTDPNPIKPGVFYDISLQANFANNNGGGYLKVAINGTQVVNYQGPLGYGLGTYWQYGLYRATAPEIAAASYRNMSVKAG